MQQLPAASTVGSANAEYAVQLVFQPGPPAVYTLDSIDGAVAPAMSGALRPMIWLRVAAFGVAGLVSLWTARTLARPIDTLSRSSRRMTQSRTFDTPLRHDRLQPRSRCADARPSTR